MPRVPWNKLDPAEKRRRNAERCKARYWAKRDECRAAMKKYREDNREILNAKKKDWYKENTEVHTARVNAYVAANRASVTARKMRWQNERIKNDIEFRLKRNMRERIRFAVKRGEGSKHTKAMNLLGCDVRFLRGYLEAKFEIGMTWENYGKWQVDHIIPCSGFNLTDPAQQKECFHYSNLQPLWAVDNNRKSDVLPSGERARYKKLEVH